MRILNLGSLNIDRTYQVDHIAEAKETIKCTGYEEFCGGKGLNQSAALARAGAEVYHAGCIGRDGRVLLDYLQETGVKTDYIEYSGSPSGHAVIQVDREGQNSIIICGGANDDITKEYIDRVLEDFGEGDMLLVQNEIANVSYAMEGAKQRGLRIAFNPSPISEQIKGYRLHTVDYFILNEVEGKSLADAESGEPEEMIERLRARFPQAVFVLTLGEKGAYCFDASSLIYQEIFPAEAVDTTGAGDTFTGYFLAGTAGGASPEKAMRYAAMASAIAVSRHGAAPGIPTLAEVERRLADRKEGIM